MMTDGRAEWQWLFIPQFFLGEIKQRSIFFFPQLNLGFQKRVQEAIVDSKKYFRILR
jgi:hypothetical protein